MCGVAGAVFWAHSSRSAAGSTVVRRMTDALAHRGPDGAGVLDCSAQPREGRGAVAVLGHRRLAIIDLSERAAQPMVSRRRDVAITFNGEIYNFKSVRGELETLGRQFRSESDTEVIVQGYEQWGEGIVERLRGMFAFAIWDANRQRLFVARDRIGIKPLYVYQ